MHRRFLGRSGLEVSVLSLGTMNFGNSIFPGIGGVSLEQAKNQVGRALEAGINLFDTADFYSKGESETLLGQALGARRNAVVVATKVFGPMGLDSMHGGLSRRHIVEACDASLRRLRTDWIDLYQAHSWDGRVPVDETLRAFDDLIRAGKVRYIGSSNHTGWQLMKALATSDRLGGARYVSQQVQYSLAVRDFEHELLPCALDQGVGGLIWSPLAQGYLTGKYATPGADARLNKLGMVHVLDNQRNRAIVETLTAIADERGGGATPGRIAVAWLLRKPGVTSVLIGPRTDPQLEDNLAAAAIGLTDGEMERLDAVSAIPVPYPLSHQRTSGIKRNPPPPARVPYEPSSPEMRS